MEASHHIGATFNKADYQHHFLQRKDIFDVIEVEKFVFCNNNIVYLLHITLQTSQLHPYQHCFSASLSAT